MTEGAARREAAPFVHTEDRGNSDPTCTRGPGAVEREERDAQRAARDREKIAGEVEPHAARLAAELRDRIGSKVGDADARIPPSEGFYPWRARMADVVERVEREAARLEEIPDAVRSCGEGVAAIGSCADCQTKWEIPATCDQPLLCPECRDREQKRRRRQVTENYQRRLAPSWTRVRMVTVTLIAQGTLEERIDRLYSAKPRFLRAVTAWANKVARIPWFDWWLSFELTAGADFEGHPHFHFMILSDYLPQPLLAAFWARAVRSVGGRVNWAPIGGKLLWVQANCRRSVTRVQTIAALWDTACLPWSVEGVRAPRRRSGEDVTDYAIRRARWALDVAGDDAQRRSIARIESDYTRAGTIERSRVVPFAVIPWLILDVRHNPAKPVIELVKYTLKNEGRDAVRPKMAARAWAALRRRHRHERSQSIREHDEPAEPFECPHCGSDACKVERRERPIGVPERSELADLAVRLANEHRARRGAPSRKPA